MIVKKKKELGGYTKVYNEDARNDAISFRARGLLVHILSLPDDWDLSIKRLANESVEGRDALYTAMNELVDNDYAVLTKVKRRGNLTTNGYVVSDDREFIRELKSQGEDYVHDGDPEKAGPEKGGSEKAGPENPSPIKEKNKQKKEVTKERKIPSWSLKAATWWYDTLEKHGLLTRAILRKNKDKIIQEWAIVLDKINRLDGYDQTEIGKTLEWLFKTKDYRGPSGQLDKGGFWFGLNNFGSISTFRGKKNGSESTKFDWMFSGWEKDQKKPNKNHDNFTRG